MSVFDYKRRLTSTANVGGVKIGSEHPICIQSMTNTSTMDTAGSLDQIRRIVDAGGEVVRLTAQGSREAENIGVMRDTLRKNGETVPLVADIHFNTKAAFTAAACCDKVRINPGNFVDPGRVFRKIEFTDEEYALEIQKIAAALNPLIDICKEHHTALRIGVNHGSLSDRIMSRYGDTPEGMVESAMEFLRVCVARNFTDVVISIKASNVRVMVATVRRLVGAMERENMHFPLHLGVTEAGDGEDGRIKSAVGIGTLLAEGIGDTIRVSLSEAPEAEIPVARAIVDYISSREGLPPIEGGLAPDYDIVDPQRRATDPVFSVGGANLPVVAVSEAADDFHPRCTPDIVINRDTELASRLRTVDIYSPLQQSVEQAMRAEDGTILLLEGNTPDAPERMQALLHALMVAGNRRPAITAMCYDDPMLTEEEVQLRASIDLGRILMNGFADGVMISSPSLSPARQASTAFAILQSARLRTTRIEYISCPGCGRTLYDLQQTLHNIKEATSQLRGLKIGVMGCIVNGPGEMADADYGYVGAGPGRVSLYKGKVCVRKNIPSEEAVDRLIELIKENGDWRDE